MRTQPYSRPNPNVIQHFDPALIKDTVHPAWWTYSDRVAASKRKREAALNDAYTRRISDAAYQRLYEAIWRIFETEVSAAKAEYEMAMASTAHRC